MRSCYILFIYVYDQTNRDFESSLNRNCFCSSSQEQHNSQQLPWCTNLIGLSPAPLTQYTDVTPSPPSTPSSGRREMFYTPRGKLIEVEKGFDVPSYVLSHTMRGQVSHGVLSRQSRQQGQRTAGAYDCAIAFVITCKIVLVTIFTGLASALLVNLHVCISES